MKIEISYAAEETEKIKSDDERRNEREREKKRRILGFTLYFRYN